MSAGHVLLGLLVERPKHGYELKREHDRRLPGAKPLAYGQVYATLQRLQRDGFAEVAETVQESGPERTVYAITEEGLAELTRRLDGVEPPAPPPTTRSSTSTRTAGTTTPAGASTTGKASCPEARPLL